MNAILRFKAWDKLDKVWAPRTVVGNLLYEIIANRSTDVLEHFEVLQYAGLVDTHKNEYCEGDICSLLVDGTDTHQEIKRAVIEYNLTVAGFCFKLCDGSGWMGLNSKNLYRAEIIGNIYEHPQMQKF